MLKVRIFILTVLIAICAFSLVSAQTNQPLSAWICLRTQLDKDKSVVQRYSEVLLTKGDFTPFDVYYFDTGDVSYREIGLGIGHKLFKVKPLGVDLWLLPYYIIATDSDYIGPCFLVQGYWGKWSLSSLPIYYLPLSKKGIRQFSTCFSFLDYKFSNQLELGVGGSAYWASGKWQWLFGPNIVIKDLIPILPGGTGDFNLCPATNQDKELTVQIQKTFTF